MCVKVDPMFWLERQAGRKQADDGLRLLPDGGTVRAVGASHYQDALEAIAGGRFGAGVNVALIATLHREPENVHDGNAVRVEINGRQVGYLPRAIAPQYKELLRQIESRGQQAACRAFIRGGWQRQGAEGRFGVVLELASANSCVELLVGGKT